MKREEYRNEKGQLHRVDGPAYIDNKVQIWYFKGAWHRVDGPAVISDTYETWYMNDIVHRVDGPANIEEDCCPYWCINNKLIVNPDEYIHETIEDFIYET